MLEDPPPAWPPVQIADLAAGALGAVTQVLAALLERERTGRGAHVVVSMTHGSHALVAGFDWTRAAILVAVTLALFALALWRHQ